MTALHSHFVKFNVANFVAPTLDINDTIGQGIEWVGFELGASDLECITLTPTPPRIWWQRLVWFKYITLTLTLTPTLLCVRIINVSTSVWRMELSVGPREYSCGLSILAFDWTWGWGWPSFDTVTDSRVTYCYWYTFRCTRIKIAASQTLLPVTNRSLLNKN